MEIGFLMNPAAVVFFFDYPQPNIFHPRINHFEIPHNLQISYIQLLIFLSIYPMLPVPIGGCGILYIVSLFSLMT